MELVEKTEDKCTIILETSVSLVNAIRRSVGEIPTLAIDEVDVYANDSALYDEVIAHRLGLIPIKNQKIKKGSTLDLKLQAGGNEVREEVLSGALGSDVAYEDMPVVLLEGGQKLELVAHARAGKGVDHAKFSPGIIYYENMAKIKITGEGEKHSELAELYPHIFTFDGKLRAKEQYHVDLDEEDLADYPGVSISFSEDVLILTVESWGQMSASEILVESCKALTDNLLTVAKAIK